MGENSSKMVKVIVGLSIGILAIIIILICAKGCSKTKEYTISFNSNGGTRISPSMIEEDDTITRPINPTREGYIFEGWYYEDKEFDFNTKVTKNMTLEAKWKLAEEKIEDIVLADTNVSLLSNTTKTIEITSLPKGVTLTDLVWKTSDASIVTVDENGNIKALKEGTATITVTSKDGKYSTICKVSVTKDVVEATGITINGSKEVTVGSSIKLTATITPNNTTDKKITWTSSNPSVATVDENGNVKAIKAGIVTITAKTVNGKTTTQTITIKEKTSNETSNKPSNVTSNATSNKTSNTTSNKTSNTPVQPTSVKISGSNKVTVGSSITLKATVSPSSAADKTVTWTSSAPGIATVDKNGKVKGVSAGTVTITAKTANGQTDTITITVEAKQSVYKMKLEAIVQDGTQAVAQYKITVTKDGTKITDYKGIVYGNYKGQGKDPLSATYYNKSIKTATITLSDGTKVETIVEY